VHNISVDGQIELDIAKLLVYGPSHFRTEIGNAKLRSNSGRPESNKWNIYVVNVNLLGDNIYTMKKSTETLIDVSYAGLEINTQKTKYKVTIL
jgi:hypothetical protein